MPARLNAKNITTFTPKCVASEEHPIIFHIKPSGYMDKLRHERLIRFRGDVIIQGDVRTFKNAETLFAPDQEWIEWISHRIVKIENVLDDNDNPVTVEGLANISKFIAEGEIPQDIVDELLAKLRQDSGLSGGEEKK